MSTIDQFESVFKAADKKTYVHEPIAIEKILVATDLEGAEANFFLQATKNFLDEISGEATWHLLERKDCDGSHGLLERVEEHHPDLTITYRHLGSNSWRWPYGLGESLDVLTQVTPNPVLVLPHPERKVVGQVISDPPKRVMAVSGHLGTDHKLVKYAIHFANKESKLTLGHVEDESTFERYLEAIAKIPELDTEVAKETILDRLLKDARDYANSVRVLVDERNLGIEVECVAKVGKHLSDYGDMVKDEQVDLVVMNAKDEDQMAMHGMAYPLAVELLDVPLLLL